MGCLKLCWFDWFVVIRFIKSKSYKLATDVDSLYLLQHYSIDVLKCFFFYIYLLTYWNSQVNILMTWNGVYSLLSVVLDHKNVFDVFKRYRESLPKNVDFFFPSVVTSLFHISRVAVFFLSCRYRITSRLIFSISHWQRSTDFFVKWTELF